jgi:hypothetical protein
VWGGCGKQNNLSRNVRLFLPRILRIKNRKKEKKKEDREEMLNEKNK